MIAKAKIRYLKISPRKLRLVLPLIRNKNVAVALATMENTNKKAATYAYKALHSAAANAKRLPNVNEGNLYVSKIFVDGGPVAKRQRAMSMGSAGTIRKRTSHLTIELDMLKGPAIKPVQKGKKVKKVQKVKNNLKKADTKKIKVTKEKK